MQKIDIQCDLHTHTLASGHAYSTINEMAAEAARKGVKYLGITEHGPAIPGACDLIYFRNLHVVPRELYGVRLLLGAEINILNINGDLDMEPSYDKYLSHTVAGLHSLCYTPGTRAQNTDALLAVMHSRRINIISHPGDGTAPLHFEPLVKASAETGTLLELNNSSLKPIRHKTEARDNNVEILRLCRKAGVPVIFGSDAHFMNDIANYEYLWPLVEETQFPRELIVNQDIRLVEEFTGKVF